MQLFFLLAIVAGLLNLTCAFRSVGSTAFLLSQRQLRSSLQALDDSVISKLEEVSSKYKQAAALDSPESNAEAEKLKEVAEKYDVYKEVKKMLYKLRIMYLNEASENRKAKQLKSFFELLQGKAELEEIMKSKLGMPTQTGAVPAGLLEVQALDDEIAKLEAKLDEVKIVMPEGMDTRVERFGGY